jgi:hypothetical protein
MNNTPHQKNLTEMQNKNIKDTRNGMSLKEHSQKIITALYMVTEHMSDTDALKSCVLKKSVFAMNVLSVFHDAMDIEKKILTLQKTVLYYTAVNSFLDVMGKTAKVSLSNYKIISEQITIMLGHMQGMIQELEKTFSDAGQIQTEVKVSDVFKDSLGPDLLNSEIKNTEPETKYIHSQLQGSTQIQKSAIPIISPALENFQSDILNDESTMHKGMQDYETKNVSIDTKGVSEKTMPVDIVRVEKNRKNPFDEKVRYNEQKAAAQRQQKKNTPIQSKTNEAKDIRHKNIISILQSKDDVSITDIYDFFTDCSSKTIQRDLNELIDTNHVIKKGSRRWSTYTLAK